MYTLVVDFDEVVVLFLLTHFLHLLLLQLLSIMSYIHGTTD